MNGTTVTADKTNSGFGFPKETTEIYNDIRYKTVNTYSFSLSAWQAIVERLDHYIVPGRKALSPYEQRVVPIISS